MSSGNFKDAQFKLNMIAETVSSLIAEYDYERFPDDDFDMFKKPVKYSKETVNEFKKSLNHLVVSGIYLKRINLLVSGEDGELNFHARLKDELEALGE